MIKNEIKNKHYIFVLYFCYFSLHFLERICFWEELDKTINAAHVCIVHIKLPPANTNNQK